MKLLEDLTTGAVENPLITCLLGIFITMLGAFGAAYILPIQQEPPVKVPVIIVSIPYPGASPWEVQSEVVRELEEKLKGLENVDHIFSTAAENVAVTTVQFTTGIDVEQAKREVRDRSEQAKVEYPKEVEEPIISDVDFEDLPALFFTMMDTRGDLGRNKEQIISDLNRIAEGVEDEFLTITGVSTIDIFGELDREVRVRLDPKRMEAYGLSFTQVGQALASQNLAMPGGNLDLQESTLSVRVAGKFHRPEEVGSVVVRHGPAGLVHLGDLLAEVVTYKKATSYSRMGGSPAITLVVHSKSGENVVKLVEATKQAVVQLKDKEIIPAYIKTTYTKDQSYWIWLMLTQLGSSALFGGILVVVVLYFGMGMRSGFLLASAIPFSVLFCCLCQTILHISINSMTLFSLILILGLVVDGAIVVGENIYRHFEMGKRPKQAALDGVHEVGVAVIAADLTTISAFLPMLFMTGMMGFWMEIMPMIVTFTLIGSILVDHFILPVLARYYMRVRPTIPAREEMGVDGNPDIGYGRFAQFAYYLANHRLLSFCLCLIPAIPLGWFGLDVLADIFKAIDGVRPDWTENGAYRFLAIFLVAVLGDYLIRSRMNARFGRRKGSGQENDLAHLVKSGGPLTNAYTGLLRFAISNRMVVAVLAFLGLFFAVMLPASGRLPFAFFDSTDTGWFFVKYELPPGASLEENYRFAQRLENLLSATIKPNTCLECGWTGKLTEKPDRCPKCGGKVKGELKSTVTTLGEATAYASFMGDNSGNGPEFGQIELELYPLEERLSRPREIARAKTFAKSRLLSWFQERFQDGTEMVTVTSPRSMFEIMDRQREWLKGRFPGVKINIAPMTEGPPVGAPITARIRGRSLPALIETAKAVEGICANNGACFNVQNTHYEGRREIRVIPDRDRAAFYGLSSGDISRSLFTAFQGWEVSKMTFNDQEVDIRLENSDLARRSIADVRDMEIARPDGSTIALRDISRVDIGATVAVLKRFDRRQAITISSDIREWADKETVKKRVKEAVAALALPHGVAVEFGGQDEEQIKSMQSLFRAYFIAIFLIFFILTGQFSSFKQPLVVIFTIPLSIVGAVIGLYATGNKLDFMAMVGIVCLGGIVVNDAIVLVDFLNKLRKKGVPLLDATILAGKARLRPIIMTTVTTVVGLLPLTLNLTGGAEFWESMGFSIICGLIVATVLTLVVIPAFYSLVERDSWEPTGLGRLLRPLRRWQHKKRLQKLLVRLGKAKNEAEREAILTNLTFNTATAGSATEITSAATELLALTGDDYLARIFNSGTTWCDQMPERDLHRFTLLGRRLAGCKWRVDARLGEHQREMLKSEMDHWVRYRGRKAPIGSLAASLGLQ